MVCSLVITMTRSRGVSVMGTSLKANLLAAPPKTQQSEFKLSARAKPAPHFTLRHSNTAPNLPAPRRRLQLSERTPRPHG